jgi:ABC-type sugar transport system ATPase subunit
VTEVKETGEAIVQTRSISKSFGGAQALADVDVTIAPGTVHALVGENGAGKSTLGKLIAGVLRPDAGELLVGGEPVSYASPHHALLDGITALQQEIALVPKRTVIENVFLGRETRRLGVVDRGDLRRRYEALREQFDLGIDPDAIVESLRLADQQKVEVLRAIVRDARVIVLDEPTAMLTADETATLLATVARLRDQGKTIVYVSHFLEEVLDIADTVTVLRNGRVVQTTPTAETTVDALVEAMLGRALAQTYPPRAAVAADAPLALRVAGLGREGELSDVDLEVRAGEIVGLAGLVGSGRSEVLRAIFGVDPHDSGRIEIDGEQVRIRSPRDAIDAGLALVPESRKDEGLHMRLSIADNVTLARITDLCSGGVVRRGREAGEVDDVLERLDVRPRAPKLTVDGLSGGNQQKVLFGKWLFRTPRVLLVDEPTRGVDVGAKFAIYELIADLARSGVGVLMVSSELEEVLGLAHRVAVMRDGRIAAVLDAATAGEDEVMHAAFGTGHDPAELPKASLNGNQKETP